MKNVDLMLVLLFVLSGLALLLDFVFVLSFIIVAIQIALNQVIGATPLVTFAIIVMAINLIGLIYVPIYIKFRKN